MSTFVALLRGINVGKAKRVPMAELRGLLTGLGYRNVRTLLNSGNAVFEAAGGSASAHAAAVAGVIVDNFSSEVPVVVKAASQLRAIATGNPFADLASDHSRLLVAFTQDGRGLSGC